MHSPTARALRNLKRCILLAHCLNCIMHWEMFSKYYIKVDLPTQIDIPKAPGLGLLLDNVSNSGWYSGQQKVSCLSRCPLFRGPDWKFRCRGSLSRLEGSSVGGHCPD